MSANTKKSFVELVEYIEQHKDRKITDDFLKTIYSMTDSKSCASSAIYLNNKVVAIFCWHHKQFEILSEVAYGLKATSSTGFNTFCKVGVSQWTKQQRQKLLLSQKIVELIETEKLTKDKISEYKQKELAKIMKDDVKPNGYATKEEVLAVLNKVKK